MTTERSLRYAFVAAAAVAFAGTAIADDEKEVCASSYENAQKLRREGKLKDARKDLVTCGNQKFPAVLVPYCVQMLHDVDEAMPSILIVARDDKGASTDDVRVIVDGEVWAEKLDGRALPIDPGTHVIRLEHAGSAPWEDKVLVNEGEHSRRIEPVFGPRKSDASPLVPNAPPAGSSPSHGTSVSLWPAGLAFGIGGAGVVVGAAMGVVALSTKSSLDKECKTKTSCPASAQGDIDKLNTMGIGSTVGFVVGGAGVVTGIVLAVVLSRHTDTSASALARPSVSPWVSPFGAGLDVRF